MKVHVSYTGIGDHDINIALVRVHILTSNTAMANDTV